MNTEDQRTAAGAEVDACGAGHSSTKQGPQQRTPMQMVSRHLKALRRRRDFLAARGGRNEFEKAELSALSWSLETLTAATGFGSRGTAGDGGNRS